MSVLDTFRFIPSPRWAFWAALSTVLACRSDSSPTGSEEKARVDPETSSAPLTAAPQGAPGSSAEGRGVGPASASDRPSTDTPMGRGFEGTLIVRLREGEREHDLRYLTRGNAARLQVNSLQNDTHFDALIWEDNISVIDHRRRAIRTVPLASVPPREDSREGVEVEKTGERITLRGVPCERYQITEGASRIDACVSALPGTFDVDKFESASDIDVPAWIEHLLAEQLLPLRATVRDAAGREQYSFDLLEYSADPVANAELTLPRNYQQDFRPDPR